MEVETLSRFIDQYMSTDAMLELREWGKLGRKTKHCVVYQEQIWPERE